MRCPCRKKSETIDYEACCGRYHSGLEPAPTAESLMRSRYAAYALGKTAYVVATWHPTTRPATLDLPRGGQNWVQLRVIAAKTDGDCATVEFIAKARALDGRTDAIHEVSRFVREDGCWLYVDGDTN